MTTRRFAPRLFAAAAALACMQATLAQAPGQPVRLRLAASLCSSMTQQVLTSQLVPPLSSGGRADAAVNAALGERLQLQRDAWFARLDAVKPFNGLYATGQLDHSVGEGRGGRYSYGLEWELFDQGRADARRQLERLRLDQKVQFLQVQRDLEQRQLQEQLLAIAQMRNKLLALLYEREVAAIRPVLERRRQELAAGRITKADLAEAEYKAERAALRAGHHGAAADVLLYPQAQELVNRIESVVLRPEAELAELAASRSADVQLQALLAERGADLPSARDRTSVRLYLERSKDFERVPQNVAGVRLRIPLDHHQGLDEVASAARGLYDLQRDSVRAALHHKLLLLADQLRLKQNDMRLLQAENRMVRAKAELACYRLDFPVAALAGDPEREVEELTLRLHELQREILATRLDLLEVLTQVSALVKPRAPQELYSLSAAP